tara:strand:+ start:1100 stop:1618 length:519 start_codon:yes stop_codon:yes gene_type:complete
MYQINLNSETAVYDKQLYFYINIKSITGLDDSSSPFTNVVLAEFRGTNTNWVRTAIAPKGTANRNNRFWRLGYQIYNTSFNGLLDSEALRKTGNVFLPSEEVYNVTFYYQTSTTNLDVANATKIDWCEQLFIQRQFDDQYNQAPVSSFTQYTTNDVSSTTTNTNVEYGTQTA